MSSKVINSICGGGSGGSASLNFSVNNYSAEKTTAGSTNEIQVYPVTTMNSWKIQSTEPESPTLNDVWLQTGSGRYEFQPVSGTPLYTAVSGASLWDGTEWVEKTTKCYYGGQWNPSGIWVLYDSGTQYVSFESYQHMSSYTSTPSFGDSYIQLEKETGTRADGIQLTNTSGTEIPDGASKLNIEYSSVTHIIRLVISYNSGTASGINLSVTGDLSTIYTNSKAISSSATAIQNIKIYYENASASATCRIYKIYFS